MRLRFLLKRQRVLTTRSVEVNSYASPLIDSWIDSKVGNFRAAEAPNNIQATNKTPMLEFMMKSRFNSLLFTLNLEDAGWK